MTYRGWNHHLHEHLDSLLPPHPGCKTWKTLSRFQTNMYSSWFFNGFVLIILHFIFPVISNMISFFQNIVLKYIYIYIPWDSSIILSYWKPPTISILSPQTIDPWPPHQALERIAACRLPNDPPRSGANSEIPVTWTTSFKGPGVLIDWRYPLEV